MLGRGLGSTSQLLNWRGSSETRSGLISTLPGASGISVASMCIGCVSSYSWTWMRYASPRWRRSHSIPKSLVTLLFWAKMSRPQRMKSAASKVGSNSVIE